MQWGGIWNQGASIKSYKQAHTLVSYDVRTYFRDSDETMHIQVVDTPLILLNSGYHVTGSRVLYLLSHVNRRIDAQPCIMYMLEIDHQ